MVHWSMTYDAALSTLILFSCHGSKTLPMRNFFESVLVEPSDDVMELPFETLQFSRDWAKYSKQIYDGQDEFVVDCEIVGFEYMKKLITLLNSDRKKRSELKEVPKKPWTPKLKGKHDKTVLFAAGDVSMSACEEVFWKMQLCSKWEAAKGFLYVLKYCNAHGLAELLPRRSPGYGNLSLRSVAELAKSEKNGVAQVKVKEGSSVIWKTVKKLVGIYAEWIERA